MSEREPLKHGRLGFGMDCVCGDPECSENIRAADEREALESIRLDTRKWPDDFRFNSNVQPKRFPRKS